MEYRRRRPDQARARRRTHSHVARPFRAGRAAALRAGQMVSRRKPAALGVRTLLAQGRRADLEECRSDRRRSTNPRKADIERRRALRGRRRAEARPRYRISSLPAFEDPAHWLAEGSRAAGQCRSRRSQIGRSGRALAHGAGVRPRASTRRTVLCCRSSAGTRAGSAGAGAASAGSCGAAICF